jgi:hypothetical protein
MYKQNHLVHIFASFPTQYNFHNHPVHIFTLIQFTYSHANSIYIFTRQLISRIHTLTKVTIHTHEAKGYFGIIIKY